MHYEFELCIMNLGRSFSHKWYHIIHLKSRFAIMNYMKSLIVCHLIVIFPCYSESNIYICNTLHDPRGEEFYLFHVPNYQPSKQSRWTVTRDYHGQPD